MTAGRIRPATAADLDAIAWVAVAASPADPVYPYRYPLLARYPEDYAKFTRLRWGDYWADDDNYIMVYECPSIEDPNHIKVVAFSMWSLPPSLKEQVVMRRLNGQDKTETAAEVATTQKGPVDRERRDANPARVAAYRADTKKHKKELFDDKYPETQLYLGMLSCHPDYQRQGAGRQLLEWGLQKALTGDLDVTLLASPMGERLYKRAGFQDVGGFRTQVEGENEYLDSKAMVLEYEDLRQKVKAQEIEFSRTKSVHDKGQ